MYSISNTHDVVETKAPAGWVPLPACDGLVEICDVLKYGLLPVVLF